MPAPRLTAALDGDSPAEQAGGYGREVGFWTALGFAPPADVDDLDDDGDQLDRDLLDRAVEEAANAAIAEHTNR